MMARNSLTGGGVQMETYQELLCSPSLADRLQKQSIYLVHQAHRERLQNKIQKPHRFIPPR